MSSVMGATDASLFGIVLLFFAYGVTFGFVVELDPETRRRLPRWMRIESVSELKHTLVEVILVYLVVDFATDVADAATPLTWDSLVLPTAILLLAGALRLISRSELHGSA